ncbi:MAG: putative ABC transporter ATP-binding protein [Candidatus Bathyarchaeota archaeon BA1]|nr:MAG: putative ABC transporter ATP-binding protein [Candidatus Bathyarchaeota archaeon BA1]
MIFLSEIILSVNNLKVNFHMFEGVAKVLDGVSLDIREGETISLVGETGCGKSVTIRTILKVLPVPPGRVAEGRILYKGRDLLNMREEEFYKLRGREMSLIPQEPISSLNPVFTIGDQLTDLILFHGRHRLGWMEWIGKWFGGGRGKCEEAWNKAIELLEKVNIPDPERVMKSYPIELSGGMCQRVLISMALAGNPSLLFADEPTTALDVTTQDQILQLLEERMREQRLSVLHITHNLGVARRIARRIYVMYVGQIVETANTKDIFNTPMHPYTRGLLASIPKLTKKPMKGIRGMMPDYTSPPSGCRFHPRCTHVLPICSKEKPKLIEVNKKHFVACHLY